ncbi:MAG TPA: choice-of-anchor tandem repeat GloVer-containing protein [Alphaproteobacteria bacterium]|nr:choice-of-anchor tandem repeat GloVer-containing protein [Alphaproteobacteria bacterium]
MNLSLFRCLAAFSLWPLAVVAQTNFTILETFTNVPDGAVPYCTLVSDTNGLFYGTTLVGGISNQGTVFVLNHNGSQYGGTGYHILISFLGTNGTEPFAGVILGSDGNLYGTTYAGGTSNFGTVFKLSRNGSGFAVLHSFVGGTDSKNPEASLIEGSDGALYGTTYFGNSATRGTIFKINKDSSGYSVLHTFAGYPTDGQQPIGRLLQGSDGALYGTTAFGGSDGAGTVFTISMGGSNYGTIYNFGASGDGAGPVAGLIEGSDHALYGTTQLGGGTNFDGSIFKINKDSSGYQILHGFSGSGTDGQMPDSELTEGADGALYGGTVNGGVNSGGIIYKLNKDGSGYTILRSFYTTGGDGESPKCALLQSSNGDFYGTTEYGGAAGAGCVFALSTSPLPPQISSLTASSTSNFLQFVATSLVQYDVQRSGNLSSWLTLATLTSQTNGQFNYSDLSPPLPCAFYRLKQH